MNIKKPHLLLQRLSHCPQPLWQQRNRELASLHSHFQAAAVLLGIVPLDGMWQVVLTRRSDLLSHHSGQIALPGGRCEPQDADYTATALRETAEEIGISSSCWQTFAPLPPLYSHSGYAVHTVPALSLQLPAIHPNPAEVAEMVYLPLHIACNRQAYGWQPLHNSSGIQTPFLTVGCHRIWGLTAAILYALANTGLPMNDLPVQ